MKKYYLDFEKSLKDFDDEIQNLISIDSESEKLDTLNIEGVLIDAYSLKTIEDSWVMIFENTRQDSVIFKEDPNYITKTNSKGKFYFQNLKPVGY